MDVLHVVAIAWVFFFSVAMMLGKLNPSGSPPLCRRPSAPKCSTRRSWLACDVAAGGKPQM